MTKRPENFESALSRYWDYTTLSTASIVGGLALMIEWMYNDGPLWMAVGSVLLAGLALFSIRRESKAQANLLDHYAPGVDTDGQY